MNDMLSPLGAVAVEVRADLTKLVAGFGEAKRQTQAFSNDLTKTTGTANRMWDSVAAFDRRDNIMSNIQAWQTALGRVQRATDPVVANQRLVSGALREAEKDYMTGAISATALAKANALAAPTLASLKDEAKKMSGGLEEAAGSQTHLLRTVETSIRAWRLLAVVFGVDMVGRLGKFVVDSLEATAALKGQAEQLGLTTAELQEYRGIAGQVGMTSKDMDSAFSTLGKNIDDLRLNKVSPFSKMLKIMQISIVDAGGKVRPTSAIFKDLIDKLRDVGDEAQRRGANLIAFGEAGAKMGELEQKGSEGVDSLREALRATGAILSEDQIANADRTAKKLDQLKTVLAAKWASTVTENASAVDKLATALFGLVDGALQFTRYLGGAKTSLDDFFTTILTGLPVVGDLLVYLHQMNQLKNSQANVATEIGQVGSSIDIRLPEATEKHGPNINLKGLLAPKGAKGKQPKFDQFAADMDRELQRQLEIEKGATTNLLVQNGIDKQIIDIKLKEQLEQIKRQLHGKEITKQEAAQLTAAAKTTADMEKEEADRKLRVALIERQYGYSSEMAQLDSDALNIAHDLARTDKERRDIEFKLLDIKQEQARLELEKQIRILQETKKDEQDQERIDELTAEYIKLLGNQAAEISAFKVQHLTGIEKFRNDLPRTVQDINEQLDKIRFDQFSERLQRAADLAKGIGDAFGQFAGDLASFKNPLDAVKSLLQSLAKTFTENVIVKPVSDWATQHLGVPLAKQAFGKAMTSGPDALTAKQFDVALAQATGTLGGLEKALPGASTAMDAVTTAANPAATSVTALGTAADTAASALANMAASAGAGGGGGAGGGAGGLGGLTSLFGGSGGGSDPFSFLGGSDILGGGGVDIGNLGALGGGDPLGIIPPTFASGGFTGVGADHEPAGVVHANEFVLNSDAVSQYGLPLLGSMNSGSASILRSGGAAAAPGPLPTSVAGAAATAAAPQLADAAAMLMQAAQMLMQATQGMGAGGKGGGILGGLLGMAGGLLMSSIGGKGGGGGLGKLLGGIFGGGKSAISGAGAADVLGAGGGIGSFDVAGSMLGIPSWSSGGFTGSGADHEQAGIVHKNEWVWDAPTTRQWMPVLQLIGSGRLPSFQGPGLGQMMGRGEPAKQPLHIHLGDMHLHGVADDRSARRSGRQALGEIQRGIGQVVRSGLNR